MMEITIKVILSMETCMVKVNTTSPIPREPSQENSLTMKSLAKVNSSIQMDQSMMVVSKPDKDLDKELTPLQLVSTLVHSRMISIMVLVLCSTTQMGGEDKVNGKTAKDLSG